MDPIDETGKKSEFIDRFRRSWFPPAAVVGAFSAFVAAAFRVRPEPKADPLPAQSPASAGPLVQLNVPAPPARTFARHYSRSAVLAAAASAHPFRRSLSGVAVGTGGRIYTLGDNEVRIFDPQGGLIRRWGLAENASCIGSGPDDRLFLAAGGTVDVYDTGGSRISRIALKDLGQPANITAVRAFKGELLVADATARLIRRFDLSGRLLGIIGDKNKTGNFMLPNRSLDFDLDGNGVIYATDSGRHQVTAWAIDGMPIGKFGKFGMNNPEDFVGCCNPINLALTPDGKVVTAEKMIARVKVYEPGGGKLLAVIGPEHFDPNCVHIHLAVDSAGRIYAADPVRREILVFSAGV